MDPLFKESREEARTHIFNASKDVSPGLGDRFFLWNWEWGASLVEYFGRKLDETSTD